MLDLLYVQKSKQYSQSSAPVKVLMLSNLIYEV